VKNRLEEVSGPGCIPETNWFKLMRPHKNLNRYLIVTQEHQEKADERTTFILLAVVLAPVLAVAIVGGYGFSVWISQLIMGPPGSAL
jgi:nitrate reductase NapE